MIRRIPFAALLLAAAPLAAQQNDPWAALTRPNTFTASATHPEITEGDLRSRLYRFAADSMEGRILGSRGNVKGTDYIAAEVRRMGLEPAGENGTYFQTLPLVTRELDTTVALAAGGTPWRAWSDFIPRDQGPGQRSIDGVPVVWGGDYADTVGRISPADAKGKLVLLTFSGPVQQTNPQGVPNRGFVNRTYPDAAGIAIVARENIPAATLTQYQVPAEGVLWDEVTPTPSYLYITRPMAESIMGAPMATLKTGTAGRAVSGTVTWKNTPSPFPARNVVAILRGSDPTLKAEYVAVGAHNDHVGMGDPVAHDSIYVVNHLFRQQGADDREPRLTPEQAAQVNAALVEIRRKTNGASARADSIYNGADDDGSGSMAVLEIAERLSSQRQKPKRSILFVWHVGEEAGLFGSQWFTDHPTVPRASIVAQLNVDMIGRGDASDITGVTKEGAQIHGNPNYVQVIGSRRVATSLGDLVEKVNTDGKHGLAFDYALDANGHPQNIYCRSDHYEYARYGIPIAFFTTGGHADYHQVTDEPQYIDYPHYTRVTKFIGDLAMNVANLPTRPAVDHPLPDPKGRCQQ